MDSQKAVFCFCAIWELRDNIVRKIEIKCLKSKTGFTFIHLIWSVHQKRLRSPTEPICLLDSIQENSCNAEKTPFEGSQCPCSDATENCHFPIWTLWYFHSYCSIQVSCTQCRNFLFYFNFSEIRDGFLTLLGTRNV